MRQGQQHRRGRSRGSSGGNNNHGHNHRKGQNPLARSFESNGPDVKVRGTAADIAAKYITLARDAQSSGDPVLGENYLQHAEHYNRMIIAYREQQMQQGGDPAGNNGQRHRGAPGMDMGEGEDGEGELSDHGMGDQPAVAAFSRHPGQEPQPQIQPRHENGRADGRGEGRHEGRGEGRAEQRHDDRRGEQGGRQSNRHDRGDRAERGERGDSPRFRDRRYDRPDYRSERAERREAADEQPSAREQHAADAPQPPIEAAEQPAPRESAPARRERFDRMKDQPEFLRRPVRRPRREEPAPEAAAPETTKRQEEPGA